MQLEVGKYYATRNGKIAKISGPGLAPGVGCYDFAGYIDFAGSLEAGLSWRADGVFDDEQPDCAVDLVREATPDEVMAVNAMNSPQIGRSPIQDASDDILALRAVNRENRPVPDSPEIEPQAGNAVTPAEPADDWSARHFAAERARTFRDRAHGAMCLMLGIAALLFAAADYVR